MANKYFWKRGGNMNNFSEDSSIKNTKTKTKYDLESVQV